jgi:hypothetical protein
LVSSITSLTTSRSLGCPFFHSHRTITDDVLAHHMLDVLHIAPTLGISVLQPNKRSPDVWWTVLDVVNNNWLFAPSWHEDLHGFVVIAVGALVERALDALRRTIDEGDTRDQPSIPRPRSPERIRGVMMQRHAFRIRHPH